MDGQLYRDGSAIPNRKENHRVVQTLDSNGAGWPDQFVNKLDQILGADSEPDPLFFVESWTLDFDSAVENLHRRQRIARQEQLHQECKQETANCLNYVSTESFLRDRALHSEFFTSASAATILRCRDAAPLPQFSADASTRAQYPSSHDEEACAAELDDLQSTTHPLTQDRACRILGVTATGTREQIKSAYRRRASQFHPDRLESTTAEARQFATEKMIEINAAYRLLNSCCR